MKILHICLWCEKEFLAYPSQERKYCSRECALKGSPPRLGTGDGYTDFICPQCGKEFQEYNSNLRRYGRQYCSQECKKAAEINSKITTICLTCGKEFVHAPSAKRKYCSHSCSAKGTRNRTGRKGTFKIFTCEVCGGQFRDYIQRQRKYCSRKCFHIAHKEMPIMHRQGSDNPSWKNNFRECEHCHCVFKPKTKITRYCSMKCMGKARTGENNPNWNGGSPAHNQHPYRCKNWRNAVLKRDNYMCQNCGATDKLHAHHIKPWASHPDSRFDIDNGLTLCVDCHRLAHSKFSKNLVVKFN